MCEKCKGEKKMTTATKPIRPTEIVFESESDIDNFINYATRKDRTNNETMNRVREMMKNHKPAKKRK